MKRLYTLIVLLLSFHFSWGNITTYFNGTWTPGNGKTCARLKSVEIRDDGVVVEIEVKALKALKRLDIYYSYNTYIISGDPKNGDKHLSLSGMLENGEIKSTDGRWGWNNVSVGEVNSYKLFFRGKMPPSLTNFGIYDYGSYDYGYGERHGYRFWNYTINNPRKNYLNYDSEYSIKQHINNNDDGICGIYEPIDDFGDILACVKDGENYCLIHVSPNEYASKYWKIGDIKAKLKNTASGILKADWYDIYRNASSKYVFFDGVSMRTIDSKSKEAHYLKTYPITSSGIGNNNGQNKSRWTGTGFALNSGYVITNHHVVDGASKIIVQGIKGSAIEYKAEVVSVDKNNDLALIKVTDSKFKGFGTIPYSIRESMCNVGDDIFVLGYPLTSYMGEEIKLTNGIISSRSGYKGDISTYQISAPVQPGNSGGPLFDSNGNIVGVINAGIPGAENVGYAVKTSYLLTLVKSSISSNVIPYRNTLARKSLSEKVKVLRNFTFFIKCER